MKKYRVSYQNSVGELFVLGIAWTIGWILVITIPFVLDSMAKYFTRGIEIYEVE
jgi:hypothetical protein